MPPDAPTPSLPPTPTQSWTQDSTLDDAQQDSQSEVPGGVIVFEKKWMVTEDGDDSAFSYPLRYPSPHRPVKW
jgi:hypothetical protein